jgi:hypothetical protein
MASGVDHARQLGDAKEKLANGDVTGAISSGGQAAQQLASDGKALTDLAGSVTNGKGKAVADRASAHFQAAGTIAGLAGGAQQHVQKANEVMTAAQSGNYQEAAKKGTELATDATNAARTAVDAVNTVAGGRAKEALSKASNVLGGTTNRLGAVGAVVDAGKNLTGMAEGAGKIMEGKVAEGVAQLGENAISTIQNAGTAASAVQAAVTEGGMAARAAGVVASGVGKLAAPLAIAQGGIQAAQALSKTPPDYKGAAVGAMNAVGGALMAVPGGQVAGAVLMGGAMVVQNWDAISGAASSAMSWFKGK